MGSCIIQRREITQTSTGTMKTILYQPIFINPQAYFVFPQLYHIEKGDSYIEPANITGQLIINDLTKSLTSTPILNVVQDTNQVDFGLFKGNIYALVNILIQALQYQVNGIYLVHLHHLNLNNLIGLKKVQLLGILHTANKS